MEKGVVLAEIKKQLWLSGPLFLTSLGQFLLQSISLVFVGHLGELALSGASMATSFAGVTGFSLLMGLGSILDTLCGQAFGARQYPLLGIYLQRAVLVLTLVSIPVSFLWDFTDRILMKLHQDKQVSAVAGIYIRWMTPALFGYGVLQCYVRFLQTQNIVFPLMIASVTTTLLHILLCWSLVFKLGFGTKGAALALSISYWFNILLLTLYVMFSPRCKATWNGISRKALHDVFSFVKVAIPSAAMVCLEFWSFESLILLSGLLPNPKLQTSVMSISINTIALAYMITMGFGTAISTRVANELGAGNPVAASLAVRVAIIMAITEGLTVGSIMISVRSIWGHVYSNEAEVVKAFSVMMPLLASFHIIDATQCVLSGILRGCGWQKSGAFINLGSFYIVGIPFSLLFAFVLRLGIKGLWIGTICALSLQDVLYLAIILCANWEKEAMKATERVHNSTVPITNGHTSALERVDKRTHPCSSYSLQLSVITGTTPTQENAMETTLHESEQDDQEQTESTIRGSLAVLDIILLHMKLTSMYNIPKQ